MFKRGKIWPLLPNATRIRVQKAVLQITKLQMYSIKTRVTYVFYTVPKAFLISEDFQD
jgi:hypothetical protein